MNNASFYIEVWVPKLGANCNNHCGSTYELFMSFRHHFVDLDENTTYVEC
jgi:hypothetical protein